MSNEPKRSLPRRALGLLCAALPHLLLILEGFLLTLLIIDTVNPAMDFINNDTTKIIMMVTALVAFIVSGMLIYHQRKQ